jgi:hypothetical protein
VEQPQDQAGGGRARRFARARAVWLAGAVPAAIYGAAIDGIVGVAVGLALWGVLCTLSVALRRFLDRRRAVAGPMTEAELFDQLRTRPCVMCGAPTLLEACLDCTEGPFHQPRRRREDVPPRDDPEDPSI